MNYAPTWSPDSQKIAFYSTRDGDWEIYVIESDGSQLARLTNSPGYDGEPSWSTDGNKIAFASDRDGDSEIFIMNADGSNVVQVTHNNHPDDDPEWSPVDDEVLYRSSRGESWYLYSISSDGTKNRQLSSIATAGRASWSRDGQEIVFVVDHESRQAIRRISRNGEEIALVFTRHEYPGNPSFASGRNVLLYDAHTDGIAASGDGNWELWSVTLDGATSKRLTANDTDDWGGQWSPDGAQLVFAGGGLNNRGYDIFVADASGDKVQRLTHRPD
jgi:TolB protein